MRQNLDDITISEKVVARLVLKTTPPRAVVFRSSVVLRIGFGPRVKLTASAKSYLGALAIVSILSAKVAPGATDRNENLCAPLEEPMKKTLAILAVLASASAVQADECAGLGLENAYLQEHFCAQLKSLSQPGGVTRSMGNSGETSTSDPEADWAGIGILREAYRADPRKTLELIERIRNAGGLPDQ